MRCLKMLGAVLTAIFLLLGAVAAATASAEVTLILPEPTKNEPLTFSSTSGEGRLLTLAGKQVKCKKDTGSGEFTTGNLGTYKVLFEGCTGEFGTTCTGVGDEPGTILQEGTVHYVLALLGLTETKLVAALAGLVKEFHFTCSVIGLEILVLVRGCIAALAEPTEKLTKTTKDVFLFDTSETSGDPDIEQILMENATKEIECKLESSISGGAFESSALKGSATNEKLKKGGKEIEVLLMNK